MHNIIRENIDHLSVLNIETNLIVEDINLHYKNNHFSSMRM